MEYCNENLNSTVITNTVNLPLQTLGRHNELRPPNKTKHIYLVQVKSR